MACSSTWPGTRPAAADFAGGSGFAAGCEVLSDAGTGAGAGDDVAGDASLGSLPEFDFGSGLACFDALDGAG